MKISKLTPDPLRDPPKGQGEHQCPGPFIMLPPRAYGDVRFNKYPTTFRCLAICSAHAKQNTSIFFVNHITISKIMGNTKSAISQHFKRLLEWGYIQKLKNSNPKLPYGQRGAKWRVIFDKRVSIEDQLAGATDIDDNQVVETLNKITPMPKPLSEKQIAMANDIAQKYTKNSTEYYQPGKIAKDIQIWLQGEQTEATWKAIGNGLRSPFEAGYLKDKKVKPQLNSSHNKVKVGLNSYNDKVKLELNSTPKKVKMELNHNYKVLTNSTSSRILNKNLCDIYMNVVRSIYNVEWRYDERQIAIAGQLIEAGYKSDTFKEDALSILQWTRKNNKQQPQSLQYFLTRHINKDKPITADSIVKRLGAKMKL